MSNFLGRIDEYNRATKAFQPMTPTVLSNDIIVALRQLHPPPLDLVPPLIFSYQLEHTFVLDKILFAQALAIVLHLSPGGLSRMVYEHFSRCLILEDPSSGFSELLQVVVVVAHGDISRSMALVLKASKLLAMAKAIGGFCPITIGKVFFQLINYSIIL